MQIWSFEEHEQNQKVSNHLLISNVTVEHQPNDEVRIISQSVFRWLGDPFHKRVTVQLDRIEAKHVALAYQSMLSRDLDEIALLINSGATPRRIRERSDRFCRYWEISPRDLEQLLLKCESPLDQYKQDRAGGQSPTGKIISFSARR